MRSEIEQANKKAVDRVVAAEAVLVDVSPASKSLPGYKENLITHAGPPIPWERMCMAQKIAMSNLAIYEGLAESSQKVETAVRRGEILVEHNQKYGNVSGMCGATSASMPVLVVRDKVHGNVSTDWQQTDMTSFAQSYERGVEEMDFVVKTLAPVLASALRLSGGINIKDILAKGLQMGDELHGLFDASRGVFLNQLLPHLVRTDFPKETLGKVGDYFNSNAGRWFCGNLMMGGCKVMMKAAEGIKHSTIVTTMARNGVEFGIRVSGLGDSWFTGPAGPIKGFTFPGFKQEDSTLDIGDSAISETRGLGAMAIAASPSQARMFGESLQEAANHVREMRQITTVEDPMFRIPYMNFEGVPLGIDIRKVVETGILPKVDTGMAHKEGGHGIIGIGVSSAPMEAFKKAFKEFAAEYA